eukprot:1159000-Pelagomonas_calceolata.AAC.3
MTTEILRSMLYRGPGWLPKPALVWKADRLLLRVGLGNQRSMLGVSMIANQASLEVVREVSLIVYDEIHYLRDKCPVKSLEEKLKAYY